MSSRFEHHARTFALLTFLSRITGLLRDATLSRIFGAGPVMDAFFFAFIIPNLFRRLFGEGALSAAFLPVYAELQRDDPALAAQLATAVLARVMLLLGGLVLAGETVLVLMAAFGPAGGNLAVWLLMIMLPYTPLVCMVALLGAMLQVHGRFGPTAAAPVILNLSIVAAAVIFEQLIMPGSSGAMADDAGEAAQRFRHIATVAGAVLAAGFIQILWAQMALRRHARWSRPLDARVRDPLRRVIMQAGPMIVGLGVLQLNTLFDGIIASYPVTFGPTIFGIDYPLAEGAMSSISFAQRLYQFPLGVFGIAVATAIFPALARMTDDSAAFTSTLQRGLRLVVFIGLPAAAGLLLVRIELTAVILQGGDFTFNDTLRVSNVLLGYGTAIWAYSMTHVLTRAFYARGDARTPVRIAISIVGLNLLLNCVLIWTPLREAGLAWSTAICAALQAALLTRMAQSRLNMPTLIDRHVRSSWIRTLLLTAAMVVVVSLGADFSTIVSDQYDAAQQAIAPLVVLVLTGIAIFASGALLLRMPESRWALGKS